MKRCPRCKSRKNPFGTNKARVDGRTFYCKPCNRDVTNEHRAKHWPEIKAKRAARRAELIAMKTASAQADEAKRLTEAVQLKLFVKNQIRILTKNGASRELIKRETKAPWDVISDTLAEMWDGGEVFTRKHGEERYFYLKRAA